MNPTQKITLAYSISTIGNNLRWLATPLLVYHITKSGYFMVAAIFFSAIGEFAASFFGGFVADRYNRKKTLMFLNVCNAVLTLIFCFFTKENIIYLFPLAFFIGVSISLEDLVNSTFIDEIKSKGKVREAYAKIDIGIYMTSLLTALGGGIIISHIGTDIVYVIDSFSFLICAFLIYSIPYNKELTAYNDSIKEKVLDILSGYRYVIFENKHLIYICLVAGIVQFACSLTTNSQSIYFMKQTYFVSDLTVSIWLSALKTGMVLGSVFLLQNSVKKFSNISLALFGYGIMFLSYLLLPFSPNIYFFIVFYLINLFGLQIGRVSIRGETIDAVESKYKSRTMALRNTFIDFMAILALAFSSFNIQFESGFYNFLSSGGVMFISLIFIFIYKRKVKLLSNK